MMGTVCDTVLLESPSVKDSSGLINILYEAAWRWVLPLISIDVNIVIQIYFQALNKVSCSEEVLAGDREGSQVAGEGRRGRG